MKILSIDSSVMACSVAIISDEKIYAVKEEHTPSKQAEKLVPMIEELLKEKDLSYDDINLLAVTVGPGSFTGVRIGMSAVKGLSLATDLPILGITSLETISWQAALSNKDSTLILAVINAMRGQVYHQLFSFTGEYLKEKTEAGICELEDLSSLLKEKNILIATNCAALISSVLGERNEKIYEATPHATYAGLLAARKFQLYGTEKLHSLEPLYIRPPDAKKPKSNFHAS